MSSASTDLVFGLATTALLKIAEDIREGIEGPRVTLLFLIYFSNAFNPADHGIILANNAYLRIRLPELD